MYNNNGDKMKKLLLCIMDGCGIREEIHGNAFKQANKPNFEFLWNNYPHSLLEASGELVGLPSGQMGNSEVGHMNIGAGRIVYQPLQLINEKIKDGSFFQNENILEVINHVKKNNSKLHILGLLSDGGIHSHIAHLMALLDMVKKENIGELYLHIFLDGRDTLPRASEKYIEKLENKLQEIKVGKIASVSGRYYAMDRDNRYERIKKAYDVIVLGVGEEYNNASEVIKSNYERDIDDEFVIPAIIDKNGIIEENDGLILFNFRPDRCRELFSALTNHNFNGFNRDFISNLKLVTMMPVSDEVIYKNAFALDHLNNTLGEYISSLNLRQLRIAETEKYAHVTYFFDGGIEKDLPKCERILIPSSKVATYDLEPEMQAFPITDKIIEVLDKDEFDLIIVNFANGDMVGHTGNMEATIKAVEAVDKNIGRLYKKIEEKGFTMVVTADHGNSDYMLDSNNNIITSHSTSLVPFIVTDNNISLENGKLADIAPTILKLMDLAIPKEMNGEVLFKNKS